MGEVRRVYMARGKRVIKVAPVGTDRDPKTVASLTLLLGSGGSATAHLTEDERRALIEALGGQVT
jgi:hypothetical protein